MARGEPYERLMRACDECKRRKVRCIASFNRDECQRCIDSGVLCTYAKATRTRGPTKSYVAELEDRVLRLTKLINERCPDIDVELYLKQSHAHPLAAPSSFTADTYQDESSKYSVDDDEDGKPLQYEILPRIFTGIHDQDEEISTRTQTGTHMAGSHASHVTPGFFMGDSSDISLIYVAEGIRAQHSGQDLKHAKDRLLHPFQTYMRRSEFWVLQPYEKRFIQQPLFARLHFPDEDLMKDLIELYFSRVNLELPLLHRPSFEASIKRGDHRSHGQFGAMVLLVCSLGARYSEDPRVLVDDIPNSRGWYWITQLKLGGYFPSIVESPRLYDLQFLILCISFFFHAGWWHVAWELAAYGLRLLQDVGAHRKSFYGALPSAQGELWKRAFWVLVSLDRSASFVLGRSVGIDNDMLIIDLPIECDDEYWDERDSSEAWKQPSGKPSVMAYFNHMLRLLKIRGRCLQSIYPSSGSTSYLFRKLGVDGMQKVVTELDSELNGWIDSIPEHLRWDPRRSPDIFFYQSASLYCACYLLQIYIHRPFIPLPRQPAKLSFPSLAICANAARSCIHVAEVVHRRGGIADSIAVSTSAVVLLMNIWTGQRSHLPLKVRKEMKEVYQAMEILRSSEGIFATNGGSWDLLQSLISESLEPRFSDSPEPQPSQQTDNGQAYASAPLMDPLTLMDIDILPAHSQELGRLPIHRFVDPDAFDIGALDLSGGTLDLHAELQDPVLMPFLQPVGADSTTYPLLGDQPKHEFDFLNAPLSNNDEAEEDNGFSHWLASIGMGNHNYG